MNSLHILIVDDDREIRELLTGFLVGHGYRVDTAADGRAMLKLMGVGRFDLIVLDVMLPGGDGLALCRWLRTTSTLPVIMLTALAEETDRIIGLEMGADDYVVSPLAHVNCSHGSRRCCDAAGRCLNVLARPPIFSFSRGGGWI
jgi:two-component system OmpR family response regulator